MVCYNHCARIDVALFQISIYMVRSLGTVCTFHAGELFEQCLAGYRCGIYEDAFCQAVVIGIGVAFCLHSDSDVVCRYVWLIYVYHRTYCVCGIGRDGPVAEWHCHFLTTIDAVIEVVAVDRGVAHIPDNRLHGEIPPCHCRRRHDDVEHAYVGAYRSIAAHHQLQAECAEFGKVGIVPSTVVYVRPAGIWIHCHPVEVSH